MKTGHEDISGDFLGLPDLLIVGVEVNRCPNCGEYEKVIPAIEQLRGLLANKLAWKLSRLTGTEFRFLRKYLGYSSDDFARKLGVTPDTVRSWEAGQEPVNISYELAVRSSTILGDHIQEYQNEPALSLDALSQALSQAAIHVEPHRLRMKREEEWSPAASPAA